MSIIEKVFNTGAKITGAKMGKKFDNEKQEKVIKIIAKKIAKVWSKKDEQEIIQILSQGDIKELITVSSRFGIPLEGMYHPMTKNIYVQEDEMNYMYETGEPIDAIVHESIHKIQKTPLVHKGKSIRGFIEGATEDMTLKTRIMGTRGHIYTTKPKIRFNIPGSSYIENVSIVEQLGVVMGKEKLEDFAFGENMDFLNEMQLKYGKDFYEKIRKGLNKIWTQQNSTELLNEMQSSIIDVCYQKKYEEIKTIDDAKEYFKELKEIDYIRGHIEGETYFEEFYKQKYEQCINRFKGNLQGLEQYEYKEPNFLKVRSWNEIKDILKEQVISDLGYGLNVEENINNYNKCKRYAVIKDNELHHVVLVDGKITSYKRFSEEEGEISCEYRYKNNRKEIEGNKSEFDEELFQINQIGDEIILKEGEEEIKFNKIQLEITQEEIIELIEQRKKDIYSNKETFMEKIKRMFTRNKVPQLEEAPKVEQPKKEFINGLKIEASNLKSQESEEKTQQIPLKKFEDIIR